MGEEPGRDEREYLEGLRYEDKFPGATASQSRSVDLTLRCPTCGGRADMCFAHGDEWKKRYRSNPHPVHRMTDHELRAAFNEFTQHDLSPYGEPHA